VGCITDLGQGLFIERMGLCPSVGSSVDRSRPRPCRWSLRPGTPSRSCGSAVARRGTRRAEPRQRRHEAVRPRHFLGRSHSVIPRPFTWHPRLTRITPTTDARSTSKKNLNSTNSTTTRARQPSKATSVPLRRRCGIQSCARLVAVKLVPMQAQPTAPRAAGGIA
jgi:hypothetical protein